MTQDDIALGNDNERMIVANLWSYWAHLSIYRFAAPFCISARVLDVGTGVGYGAAYLADRGASVHAVDGDAGSITHARRKYAGKSVTYDVADLNQRLSLEDRSFDLVFSSNVFEHIAKVDQLVSECARVVAQDGVVIVAVPPVTLDWIAESDVRNHHHVNHLPPSAWYAKLSRFFRSIDCHGHQGSGKWGELETQTTEIARWTDETTIRETDFEFPAVSIEKLNRWQCVTSVFVCRDPRIVAEPETLDERPPSEWCIEALAAKIIAEERAQTSEARRQAADAHKQIQSNSADIDRLASAAESLERRVRDSDARIAELQSELQKYQTLHHELVSSTTWRLSGPLRRVIASSRSLAATFRQE